MKKPACKRLERLHQIRPMKPGLIEALREYEYKRYGTLTLIANFEVATGHVIAPTIRPTRTEEDFARHLAATLDTDPQAPWIFVMDQLNIHKSESLVRLVAERCDLDIDLGVKGQSGVLKSIAEHGHLFDRQDASDSFCVYAQTHLLAQSGGNLVQYLVAALAQAGKLCPRLRIRLLERVLAFIAYFNATLAKPFKWTYKGRPLSA